MYRVTSTSPTRFYEKTFKNLKIAVLRATQAARTNGRIQVVRVSDSKIVYDVVIYKYPSEEDWDA